MDKKETEVRQVNSLKDIDYVRAVLNDGDSVRINKADLMKICLDFIKINLNIGIPVEGYQGAEDGLFWTPDKYIGASAVDGGESVMLITPIIDLSNTRENWRGCVGRFQLGRGHAGAGNVSNYIDVVLTKAYNAVISHCISTLDGVKLGSCLYNGQQYLAIFFSWMSLFGISFSGRFSGNCVFKRMSFSEVTEWVDL